MKNLLNHSDSLIENLCLEVDSIRHRSISIINSINNCKDKNLISRLKIEFKELEQRRKELLYTSKYIMNEVLLDSVSVSLLIELCRRPYPNTNSIT